MRWQSISDIVQVMHAHKARAVNLPDIKMSGALLAISVYGERTVLSAPALINIGTLTMLMDRLVVHRLSAGATRTVHETDLHTLPGEPPRLLRRAWIVESRRPEAEPLFGSTASLAGYLLDGTIYLIGVQYPDGIMVSRWRPDWAERDLDTTVTPDEDSPLIDDVDAHHEWARQAARFAVILGLLLEAEGSPVTVEDERPRRARDRRGGSVRVADGWVTRRVYINERKFLASPDRDREPGQESAKRLDAIETTVLVRGHVKRQPYGPGRQMRKWIYVQSYEARRWVSPRPMRVDVGVKE